MMKYGVVVFLLALVSLSARAQKVEVIKISDFEKRITTPSEKIQVINFWATWCAPCVKELPLFEKVHLERKDVQVSLISLDADLDPTLTKVRQFVAKKKLQSPVYVLVAGEANQWIDRVDKSWSGAIPATLFVNTKTGKRKFVEGELDTDRLDKWIEAIK